MTPPPRAVNQPQPVLRREAGPPVAPAPSRRGSGAKWTGVAAAAKDCEPAQVSTYEVQSSSNRKVYFWSSHYTGE